MLIYLLEGALMKNSFKIKWNADSLIPEPEAENSFPTENGIELGKLRTDFGSSGSIPQAVPQSKELLELEYLAMLEDYHKDLFDHPIISSLIWSKWNKLRIFFWMFSLMKIFQHVLESFIS